ASARADEAIEAADELDLSFDALRSYRLLVEALTGHEVAAAASASAAYAAAIERGDEWSAALFARAGGVAALVAGTDADAARLLGETVRIGRRFGVNEPSWFRVHGDLVESLVRVGDLDGATELIAVLDASAARTGIVWTRLVGARGRALGSGAVGDLDVAVAAASEARELAGDLGSPYEQARTDLVAGVLERRMRRKRAARELLAGAADTFERIGAPTWAGRARAELGRVGVRVRAPDQLSESERRVAELAAAGRTNREIADALFLSVRTVESHLGVTYRKLGVRSRTELARVLGSTG
ncbi:MAG: helix-turn-helix transcriptional regulator, partial [Ilumatobacteraceae bacterium]|nr:helix-turn-helix transcriptional regulator [Ilumatobacteraceae bacterium]